MAKKKENRITLFCYICKEWFTVKDHKEFKQAGHYGGEENKVPFLAPDFGRTSMRHERAVKDHARLRG